MRESSDGIGFPPEIRRANLVSQDATGLLIRLGDLGGSSNLHKSHRKERSADFSTSYNKMVINKPTCVIQSQ